MFFDYNDVSFNESTKIIPYAIFANGVIIINKTYVFHENKLYDRKKVI